jgi:hypothetical protein
MKPIDLYPEFRSKVKEGDSLLTQVNSHPSQRIVKVEGNGVRIEGEWFDWDFFFEVNHPIKILINEP